MRLKVNINGLEVWNVDVLLLLMHADSGGPSLGLKHGDLVTVMAETEGGKVGGGCFEKIKYERLECVCPVSHDDEELAFNICSACGCFIGG